MGISSGLRRVGALVAASSVVVGLLAVAPTALAVGATQSTTALGPWSVSPVPVGMGSQITATVTGQSGLATGTVAFSVDSGTPEDVAVDGSGQAAWTLPSNLSAGSHSVRAQYLGDATYAASEDNTSIFVGPRAVVVDLQLSGTPIVGGVSAEIGDKVTATVSVSDLGTTGSVPVSGGHIDITVDGTKKAGFDLPQTQVDLATATWAQGDHQVRAFYVAGAITDHADGATSNMLLTLVPNTVKATAGVQYSIFYPYRDGYRDTDLIRGVRNETARVAIRIYNSSAKLVRSQAIVSGTGAWSFAWNGKTATGTALAAGKYTIKQVVTDSKGLSKTFVAYITISPKRLYTYTKTLTKTYAQRSAEGTYSVGWVFTLPSATVYKKLVFGVYGSSSPAGDIGAQDFRTCSRSSGWNWTCANPTGTIGSGFRWWNLTASPVYNRSGTYVRLYADALHRTNLKQGRVTVTYGILK
jgi:hypothetical protein